ncbi:MAG: AAA family ATPase [Bacillota bacterium]|nr:AAA family ATPase [Bacillota bacterium]
MQPATPGRTLAARPGEEADDRRRRLEGLLGELDALVGLTEVKELVHEITAYAEIRRHRLREGLAAEPMSLHMLFFGNPGTGKTTVARLLGKILCEMGLLQRGHLVEVERADLVGEYVGHTAQKTRQQVRKALGGLLFVDEAYSLARGGEKDFGKEAIDTLVKAMEDHKDQFILILAGYPAEMERFIDANPGLASRLPIHLRFPDYSTRDLMAIAEQMIARRQYTLASGARDALYGILLRLQNQGGEPARGNARTVRNLVERAMRLQARRLFRSGNNLTRSDLVELTAVDFLGAERWLGQHARRPQVVWPLSRESEAQL